MLKNSRRTVKLILMGRVQSDVTRLGGLGLSVQVERLRFSVALADTDECESGQAGCAHGCRNTPGSFACTCDGGYELGSDSRRCFRESLLSFHVVFH